MRRAGRLIFLCALIIGAPCFLGCVFADEGSDRQKDLPKPDESFQTDDLIRQTDDLLKSSEELLKKSSSDEITGPDQPDVAAGQAGPAQPEAAVTVSPQPAEKSVPDSAAAQPVKESRRTRTPRAASGPEKTDQKLPGAEKSEPQKNLYAENFFVKPNQRLKYKLAEIRGFVFVENPNRDLNSRYALVTDFGGSVLKSQQVPGMQSLEAGQQLIQDHLETDTFQGAEIRALSIPLADGRTKKLYWVGHRAFDSAEKARAEIALVQSVAESSGGDFARMIKEAQSYLPAPEQPAPVEIGKPANFEREEALALKMFDALDIGTELFGPFQGVSSGEKITWQSFGETSFRTTNLNKENFNAQVAYWSNRLVFKGIRAPFSTVDPFVESTVAMESDRYNYASHLDLGAGLEWRPFSRSAWLYNFRPWSLPLLEFVRNYRAYVAYFDRKPIKDEITGSKTYDFKAGVSIFYEWGVDPPPLTEGPPSGIPDYLRRYVWGEYFGDYRYEKTGFSTEDDFDAWIWNSSVVLGVRLPGIPVPANPIMDDLVLMPYMRFEHVNNTGFSFPYQNRYFVAAGMRWMPFNNYRFGNNEWLSKAKLFVEYVGVGATQNVKTGDDGPMDPERHDLRFGLNYSYKRF